MPGFHIENSIPKNEQDPQTLTRVGVLEGAVGWSVAGPTSQRTAGGHRGAGGRGAR